MPDEAETTAKLFRRAVHPRDTRVTLKRVSDVEKAAWPVVFDATPLTGSRCVPAISSP